MTEGAEKRPCRGCGQSPCERANDADVPLPDYDTGDPDVPLLEDESDALALAPTDPAPSSAPVEGVAEEKRPLMRVSEASDSDTVLDLFVEICTMLGADFVVNTPSGGGQRTLLVVVSARGFGAARECREARLTLAGMSRHERLFLSVYRELSAVADTDALEMIAAATQLVVRQKRRGGA